MAAYEMPAVTGYATAAVIIVLHRAFR